MILILDFGSQVTQLIGRRLRELNVYCEIHPYNKIPVMGDNVKGVILSGSPFSVRDPQAPFAELSGIKGKLPLLGICYGAQFMAHHFGGEVNGSIAREYGRAMLTVVDEQSPLFKDVSKTSQVWMSHGDTIAKLPTGARVIASTNDVENAAYQIEGEETYAVQFHPEVFHPKEGPQILAKNLTCIFVDNGLLRKNEFEDVLDSYKEMGLNVIGVHAGPLFLKKLEGVTDPEAKRKAIGSTFIEVFDAEAQKIEGARWLAQGTIYPDVIESVSVNGPSCKIKSHHNVGGLPEKMNLKIVEPLRSLFKDEVRRVGRSLGIKRELIGRHPFPGPSLGIRILGEVTEEKLRILRDADDIFIRGLREWPCELPSASYPNEMADNLYDSIWQAGTMLLPVKSVGVMGDERSYEYTIALRAVISTDGMTADWVHLPYEFMAKVSNDIINKVKGVNRVCYDISSKPPATIEWE